MASGAIMASNEDKLLALMTDNEVLKAQKEGLFENEDEFFGALCFATRIFGKGYKLKEVQ